MPEGVLQTAGCDPPGGGESQRQVATSTFFMERSPQLTGRVSTVYRSPDNYICAVDMCVCACVTCVHAGCQCKNISFRESNFLKM